jgi:hypothetical protein
MSVFNDDTSGDRDWLNPIAMSQLCDAAASRSESVTLNGILYTIRYDDGKEHVHLKRADGGFVPMGFVEYHRIRGFQFE